MSLRDIKFALLAAVHDSEDKARCTKCRADAEIAALEQAAQTLGVNGILSVLRERNQLTKAERKSVDVIATIAKEAE